MGKIIKRTKAAFLMLLFLFVMVALTACVDKKKDSGKKDIEFTVCDKTKLPEELVEIIEEKKEKECKLTYINGSYMYIVVCYGEHSRDNLNVIVNDLYITEAAVYVDTTLATSKNTPTNATAVGEYSMYPYIVLKCEKYDLPVIFDID